MRTIIMGWMFLLLAPAAFAGGSDVNTTVTAIGIDTVNNRASITLAANLSGGPSCGQSSPATVGVNLATNGGQETLKAAQIARVLGYSVNVYGTGACTTYSYYEDASSISVF